MFKFSGIQDKLVNYIEMLPIEMHKYLNVYTAKNKSSNKIWTS